jgi:hypothetical protein
LEAGAKGAEQSESPDSTKELSEHMFGEQVFVLGQPNIVTQVTVRTVVCVRRTLQCDEGHRGCDEGHIV